MNITMNSKEIEALRKEVSEFRTTRDLILSVIADCKRYGTVLDVEWVEMMLNDVEPRS